MMEMIRIFLADDHVLLRQGTGKLLLRATNIEVVEESPGPRQVGSGG